MRSVSDSLGIATQEVSLEGGNEVLRETLFAALFAFGRSKKMWTFRSF